MPGSWRRRAVCRSYDPDIWFDDTQAGRDTAAAICATCPVQVECEQHRGEFGTWGGQWYEPVSGDDIHATRRARFDEGLTDEQMAVAEDVPVTDIRRWRWANELPRTKDPEQAAEKIALNTRRFNLHATGWSDEQIAESEQVSVGAIRQWRIRNGLPPNHPIRSLSADRRTLYDRGHTDHQIGRAQRIPLAVVIAWRRDQALPPNPVKPKDTRP